MRGVSVPRMVWDDLGVVWRRLTSNNERALMEGRGWAVTAQRTNAC